MYNDVLDLVPGFRDQMSTFVANPEALDKIIDVVRHTFFPRYADNSTNSLYLRW
jgi:hypothetical protein